MAKRVSEVLGKPIVSATTGEKLGNVSDLLLEENGRELIGLVVKPGVMRREAVLPVSAVQSIGRDAVISRSAELIPAGEWQARDRETAPGTTETPR